MEDRRKLVSGFYNLHTDFLLFVLVIFVMSKCGHACDKDGELTSPCPSDQDSLCRNGKCHTNQKLAHTTGSLAAVISVCTILMLCFWGLLCFACYKQCKECRGGYSGEFPSSTVNSMSLDFTSMIDIPDDFIRNARIPSAEDYSGPPPYLCLFNPIRKDDSHEKTHDEKNCPEKKDSSDGNDPPNYKSLFSNGPPQYHEVVREVGSRQTAVV